MFLTRTLKETFLSFKTATFFQNLFPETWKKSISSSNKNIFKFKEKWIKNNNFYAQIETYFLKTKITCIRAVLCLLSLDLLFPISF